MQHPHYMHRIKVFSIHHHSEKSVIDMSLIKVFGIQPAATNP